MRVEVEARSPMIKKNITIMYDYVTGIKRHDYSYHSHHKHHQLLINF